MTEPDTTNDLPKTAGVIGVGLIGGSIAAGLVDVGWTVIGYDADPDAIQIATDRSLVTQFAQSIDDVLASAPAIVVVAAPPTTTIEILSNLDTDLPIMDVAGVKAPIAAAAARLPRYVGTHPMAGRETSGPAAASAALFRGASWVLVDGADAQADASAVKVIETLGARVTRMSAEDHDSAVARISHLPQLLSGALLAAASESNGAIDLAAGSFRDLTRVAASQSIPWVELLKANSNAVLDAIGSLKTRLAVLEAALVSDDDTLLTLLATGRETRRKLGAPVAAVRIALADEPGEMAKVGHALETSKVDVRDIQMRHAPHGGGGVLTISVRTGEEGALAHALEDVGLLLVT
ncbi:MAG: prephenate dehydrogenase/arogenate dehydrogenase family protein [Acidimicrobiia bacterium]|nr:prephenate dehydrogenase/arogenate dehydrogenase family protein [Acidimicrobiia bacterium]